MVGQSSWCQFFVCKNSLIQALRGKMKISWHIGVGYMDILLISGKHMALYGMRDCSQSYLLST